MDYQKNLKYFKSTDTHYYIGLPMFIIGAALFVLGYVFWMYFLPFQNMIGLVLFVLGALVAFVPRSLRSSEKDIDEAIAEMTRDYEKNTAEALGITIDRELAPALTGAYTYEDGTLLRRGKIDRKFRSNHYTATAILCTKNGMCLSEKTFSLTENDVAEALFEFHFSEIDGLFVETEIHRFENGDQTTAAALTVKAGGKTVHTVPVTQNASLDHILDAINMRIARMRA